MDFRKNWKKKNTYKVTVGAAIITIGWVYRDDITGMWIVKHYLDG